MTWCRVFLCSFWSYHNSTNAPAGKGAEPSGRRESLYPSANWDWIRRLIYFDADCVDIRQDLGLGSDADQAALKAAPALNVAWSFFVFYLLFAIFFFSMTDYFSHVCLVVCEIFYIRIDFSVLGFCIGSSA
jgi:hypothetical protein